MDLSTIVTIGAALLGGGAAKHIGKARHRAGNRPIHKVLAPAAAIGVGVGVKALAQKLAGVDLPLEVVLSEGGAEGATAIAVHSTAKNLIQLIRGR